MELIKKRGDLIQWLVGVGDLIVLNLLFFAVYVGLGDYYLSSITPKMREIVLLLNFCYFFALYFVPIQLHLSVVFLDKIVQRAIVLITFFIFLFATCLVFLNVGDTLATFLLVYYGVTLVVFSLWRVIVRVILKMYRRKGYNFKQVIIIGAGKNGMELYRLMKDELAYGFIVVGFFDDNEALKEVLPNYIGKTDEVYDFVGKHDIDEIYCTLPGTQDEKMLKLLNFSEKNMIRFYIVPEFYRNVKKSLVMDMMESIPLLSVRREPLQSAYNRALKRSFDIVFSSIVLVTVYPVLYVILGILIKISSPGPVFFKQKRTGIYGQEFECYKFRTMRVNPDADTMQALKDDPRKTRLGDFLRKTNLDEFPQFINVLKGDMSVVGPRPHMLKHTEQYSALIDKYMVRHLVKPGVTGWAQVTGYRGETKTLEQMEGRVKRDVWYIENWSFVLDLKIIVVTILNMFKGERNAY
ncbi:putative colanic acid biosynthesis UDP-glucose lipid carrier transferase [Parabacteroides sp. PF5-5]|uniref:undecaprenyl-phosphate glucose phosphotransferase n=1 Tax=unclassified Parabacteroides TaxID=2649774 RepID=UPI002474BFEB|nr:MULTISPECIES: undecaprenyl-phosphate glucose phosphotransferase [unclassified Parabacteroides]MDH6304085.1 putative colanic acid biosynthesis UDP-glucose lipid carrier transferase [Parabacteroides sp. PH5-39]MDH6315215.1 putative colanic acid biosynthesis UDP-glucose lipid carrier transferase [Parabacteroides sp. PF5-13]MDH6318860.1 putative colanic acid biosynthesis UDP-glucose lipid carrier transferase [Parabacteroides sp. PH5-13]MDH6322589.1 putative colanic acid biosynthesis UDP-glucose 